MSEGLDTKNENSLWEEAQTDIYARLDGIPEERQLEELKKIFKEYGINEDEVEWEKPEEKEVVEKKKSILRKAGEVALTTGVSLTLVICAMLSQTKNKGGDKKIQKIEKSTQPVVKKVEEKKVDFNARFNLETQNLLPEKGKELYKFIAEFDPNPGYGYMILDKDSAVQYIFDDKNKLVSQVKAGFGQDAGDEKNTSYVENTGKMTTPAGGYLLIDTATAHDAIKYKGLGFSIHGFSVLGDIIDIGVHPIYPDEFESRSQKMEDGTASNNAYSNGCINVYAKDIEEKINPYIRGGAFLFVLPDAKSRASGIEFKASIVIKNIIPMVINMIDKEQKKFEDLIPLMKTERGKASLDEKLTEIKYRRKQAQGMLAKQ